MDDRRTTVYNLPPELANHSQYEVLRELGAGGMGVVYLAKNKLMDRPEVLKVVNKALLDRPGSMERFLREIRSAARLNHPNIVAAYSALQIGSLLVFAMEYVEGEDLHAVVKARGPLPVAHACHYVQQAAIGLQHAFEKGMVHRDIKPQNLIVAREGKKHIVKVLDFGLAKATQEDDVVTGPSVVAAKPGARVTRLAELTGAGQMLGTPGYVAPEQTVDAARADSRADIYSLGCTLYFLLTGQPPYRGKNVAEILYAHQATEAPPLHIARAEVPAELAAVVRKMMAKKPADRYQTPAEVVQALAAAARPTTATTTPKSSAVVTVPGTKARSEAEKRLLRAETILPASNAAPTMVPGRTVTPVEVRRVGRAHNPRRSAWKGWLLGTGAALVLLGLAGLLVSGVIRLKAKDSTLVLENVPDVAEVSVDGETIALRDLDGHTITLRVKAGRKHPLQVKKAGFKVFGEEVEIASGDSRVIVVRLQPEPVVAQNPPEPDRNKEESPAPVNPPSNPVPQTPEPVKPTPEPVKPPSEPVKPTPEPVKPTPTPEPRPDPVRPAPVPAEPANLAWDKPVDPDGDCTFKNDGGKLTITVPGTPHRFKTDTRYSKAPLVLFDVEGDFTVQVRVGGDFTPTNESSSPGNVTWIGAGLLLWGDAGNYLRFEREAMYREGRPPYTRGVARYASSSGQFTFQRFGLPSRDVKETYLRLERRGRTILLSFSEDGKLWNGGESLEIILPAKIKLGLIAESISAKPFAPTFDQFQLKKGQGDMLCVDLPNPAAKEPIAVKPPPPPKSIADKPETPKPPTPNPATSKPVDKVGVVIGKVVGVNEAKKTLRVQVQGVSNKNVDVEWQATDDVKVRMIYPPERFDDKGRVKKYTKKELKELKGNDQLPGYPAEFSVIKIGQIVQLTLVRKKGGPQDAAADPTEEYAPHMSLIVIQSDPKNK